MKEAPQDYEVIGDIMSNFDHKIKDDAEETLIKAKTIGSYPAQNFWALVWWEDDKFYAEIKQYKTHVNTIEGDSLSEIMEIASDLYGHD